MTSIRVQSPTRVDLAGGTLDMWPLFLFVGGAKTVNVAIDIWTRVEITPKENGLIELESVDLGVKKSYLNLQECLADSDRQLHLLQAQLRYYQPKHGFHLKASSESPVGGGLGGSSSLTITLLRAFEKFCQLSAKPVHQLVDLAHNIEAEVLNTPTGTQDYYPAASGGLNILNYGYDGVSQEVHSVVDSPLASHFLLVYTGKSHHSGLNNFEVLKGAIGKDPTTIKALQDLKHIADDVAKACLSKKWEELPGLFRHEFEARVRLAPAFSCPEIMQLNQLALQEGAEAVKICGAGGGGCVMVWVSPANRERVALSCQKAGFKVLNAKPVDLKT
jgi:D-glycero-alpha-D-manno-heptose-7-phosphate kinase